MFQALYSLLSAFLMDLLYMVSGPVEIIAKFLDTIFPFL